jgi:hypothetical protein
MALCKDDHRYLPSLQNLQDGQAGAGRHKCAGCAYEQGFDDAFENRVSHLHADRLDDSQAGTGRHKDTQAAYDLGYTNGQQKRVSLGQSRI